MEKKGVSDIIVTILIILLALAVIIIVWQAVKQTVQRGAQTIESQSGCLGLDLTIGTVTCVNSTNAISFSITRGGDNVAASALVVSVTDATGNSKSLTSTKSLAALGVVTVTQADFTSLDIGMSTTINTGIKLDDGTLCAGATKTQACTA